MIDFGAIIFLAGTILAVWSMLKGGYKSISHKLGQIILCMLMIIIGGILMIVDYYIIQEHTSFVTNAIL
ncbi:MAG: hypothetical protein IKA19_00515 [Muribaculaceae bacterium]|nr:hypothetical protein [Muribaculaceae bacterium]